MNRCIFIIPYFGQFKNYFQLFLNSCERNPDFDWMILTDNYGIYRYPQNVHVQYLNFQTLKEQIQSKYDFRIRLEAPYKICEYKLAFGDLFQNLIAKYEFWGFCDTDMIFGDIGRFITDRLLDSYDKLLFRGHLTLMKNEDKCNYLYKLKKDGMPVDYRYAFSTDYICHFDEHEMWEKVAETEGIREYRKIIYADIDCDKYAFKLAGGTGENNRQIFEYNNGKILRYYINSSGETDVDEWCYIHLQKRKMEVRKGLDDSHYLIVPNKFIKYEKMIDNETIMANSNNNLYLNRKYSRGKEIIRNVRQGALKCRLHVWRMRNK